MRACIQRVREARVTVGVETVGEIAGGLVVLLGVGVADDDAAARQLAEKTAQLRIFEDDQGKMNRSLVEVGGGALVISQFTLFGDCRKGRRPSFVEAARPEQAEQLYEHFVRHLRTLGVGVETGHFQSHMDVTLTNDGPVTILLDTDKNF